MHTDVKITAGRPEMFEYSNGTREWRINGQLHREDGPAIEYSNGTREWRINGQLHREDGPAIEYADGGCEWWIRGQLHREDGPAAEYPDGTREWWIRGQLHREDGPAAEFSDGTRVWYINDQLHREDGPARELPDGTRKWYRDGQPHREDGPAVERADGSREWWIRGQELTEEEFKSQTKIEEKTMKITAKEARELAGPTPAEHVEAVYPMIRAAAEKRQRSIRIGTGFWAEEGYKTSEAYKQACKLLEADGFVVKFYYVERQFVDMGTEISW